MNALRLDMKALWVCRALILAHPGCRGHVNSPAGRTGSRPLPAPSSSTAAASARLRSRAHLPDPSQRITSLPAWVDLLQRMDRDGTRTREGMHELCQQALDSLPLSAWTADGVLPKHVALLAHKIAKSRFPGDWPAAACAACQCPIAAAQLLTALLALHR